jgi:hypothetical protein
MQAVGTDAFCAKLGLVPVSFVQHSPAEPLKLSAPVPRTAPCVSYPLYTFENLVAGRTSSNLMWNISTNRSVQTALLL